MCGIQVLIRRCIMINDDNERPKYLFQCDREHYHSTAFKGVNSISPSHSYLNDCNAQKLVHNKL